MNCKKINKKGNAKVLIIGSGGREHALGWKIAQSEHVSEVIYATGNAGTALESKSRNISLGYQTETDFEAISKFISDEKVDLTIIGPEEPLANGIVDSLGQNGHNVFSPSKNCTKLESDKFFSYDLMDKLNIPQAKSVKCYTLEEAIDAINHGAGTVIKARGLAAGKGVAVCDTKDEALENITHHCNSYGKELLIAEKLVGEEFSVFGICNGTKVTPIKISFQDHKRLLDDDKGPNTGGMGAYGPAPIADAELIDEITNNIMTPVIQELYNTGNPYCGFLYAGMMMTKSGLKVIEFNCRFGDPECQAAMMLIKSDLYEIIWGLIDFGIDGLPNKKTDDFKLEYNPGSSCCVIIASKGYPEKYQKGFVINGLENCIDAKIFHSGTKLCANGNILTNGGRILGVTGYSPNGFIDAQAVAYKELEKITIEGGFQYRKDIGKKGLGGRYDKNN